MERLVGLLEYLLRLLRREKWEVIGVEDVRCTLGRPSKWKSPGKDNISNFFVECLLKEP